jgi:hypothetical protein
VASVALLSYRENKIKFKLCMGHEGDGENVYFPNLLT